MSIETRTTGTGIISPEAYNGVPNTIFPFWGASGGGTGGGIQSVQAAVTVDGAKTTYKWSYTDATGANIPIVTQTVASKAGVTFTPHVSDTGVISWTNDGGLPNPDPVLIQGRLGPQGIPGPQGVQGEKGEKGDQGIQGVAGPQGIQGIQGVAGPTGNTGPQGVQGVQGERGERGEKGDRGDPGPATIAIGSVTEGDEASVTNSGTDQDVILDFVLPKGATGAQGQPGVPGPAGEQGIQGVPGIAGQDGSPGRDGSDGAPGAPGQAATIEIGTVTAGDEMGVTNSGTENAAVLDFVLQRGLQGEKGEKGDPGPVTVTVGTTTTLPVGEECSVTNSGTDQDVILDFAIPGGVEGPAGAQGEAATIEIGSVGEGVEPSVENVGTATNAILDFVLPRGPQGEPGAATIAIGEVTTGDEAAVVNVGTSNAAILNITLPRGEQGIQGLQGVQGVPGDRGADGIQGPQGLPGIQGLQGEQGIPGNAATIEIGEVTDGDEGSVINVGTENNAILNFVLPRGATGAQGQPGVPGPAGEAGPQGIPGIQGIQGEPGVPGPAGEQGIQGIQGETGPQGLPGRAATVTIGSVTSGSEAQVTNSGTETDAVLNFVLQPGATGPAGADGAKGADGVTPSITATASVSSSGSSPSCTVTKTGTDAAPNFAFAFSGLSSGGGGGNTGSLTYGWAASAYLSNSNGYYMLKESFGAHQAKSIFFVNLLFTYETDTNMYYPVSAKLNIGDAGKVLSYSLSSLSASSGYVYAYYSIIIYNDTASSSIDIGRFNPELVLKSRSNSTDLSHLSSPNISISGNRVYYVYIG